MTSPSADQVAIARFEACKMAQHDANVHWTSTTVAHASEVYASEGGGLRIDVGPAEQVESEDGTYLECLTCGYTTVVSDVHFDY